MTSSESEGHPPPRKRSRASANSEDAGNKKARGRPRVDTQDATAADRRRTQIRLAQRAYRQRKETTIASLKQENSRLQSIIEQLNKSFLDFNDNALKSGLIQLNPTLARELKLVTETFVNLARSAATEGDCDGDEENCDTNLDLNADLADPDTSTKPAISDHQIQEPDSRYTDVGLGYVTTFTGASSLSNTETRPDNERTANSAFFPPISTSRYQSPRESRLVRTTFGPTVGQLFDQSRLTERNSSQEPLPFGLIDLMRDQALYQPNPSVFSVKIPTPAVTPPTTRVPTPPILQSLTSKTLPSPYTYSHDETTFARRLTRSALETGFHLLSNRQYRPAAVKYVFRLSLLYVSVDELIDRFKILLARSTEEELDCWETPFIHLGGAGTHYPRKDGNGNIIHIPNAWNIRSIGPQPAKLLRAENTADPSQSHNLNVDLTGFEGEWFDAHDVQGYLEQEKRCFIDPKDSFAEVLIEVEDDFDTTDFAPNLLYSKDPSLNLDLSDIRKDSSVQSRSPALSHGFSSTDTTASMKSTPGSGNSTVGPSGLNLGSTSLSALGKTNEVDLSNVFDQPLGLDLAPSFDNNVNNTMAEFGTTDFGDMSNLALDLMSSDAHQMPVVKQKRMKTAWIDVSKLIDEIVRHGVCLGRAPGYRRTDVDMAFQSSLIHAF